VETQSPSPKRGRAPQIFGPCLLWLNGLMDQDATWHGGKPQPRRLCARWGPSTLQKRGLSAPPIFGSCLLRSKGCMDQDATWYAGGPRPRRHCVRWGPSSVSWGPSSPPLKGQTPPNFWPISVAAKWLRGLSHLVWRYASAQATLC